jgi:diaminopropionate ammonia-lyase
MLIANTHASHTDYPDELKAILSVEHAEQSRAWLSNWSLLNASATPLWDLPDAAARLGVARLSIKDESVRSPLGSFKALGAPIALVRLILRLWPKHGLDPRAIIQGRLKEMLAKLVVISATDGNHGKALAAAAHTFGCHCVIVLHANVSAEREQAIAAYGARIIRISGNYDESVAEAARLATANGWHVVSDTSYEGYETIPRDVMQGYGPIAAEIIEQSETHTDECAFTHVFLQGGVGGLAAGVASCWRRCKSDIRRRRKVGVKASGTVSSCCRQLSGVLAPESEWIGLVVTRMRVSRRRALFAQHFVERNLIARDDALAQIIEEFDDGERLIGRPVARDQEVQSMGDT